MGKKFLIGKLARVIAWVLAGVIGSTSTQAESASVEIAGYIVSAVMAGVTFYLSMKNDKTLLETEPPKK